MLRRLAILYARRVVNVNVNIVLAGLLALAPTLAVVRLMEYLLATGVVSGARLHLTGKMIITATTFVADIIFDVAIYYALHWLANHWRRKGHDRIEGIAEAAAESVPFFRDATKVQLQRMVISPLLYVLFLGIQFVLMAAYHVRPVWATVVGFGVAILVARTLHTFWLLREERLGKEIALGRVCPGCRSDLRGVPNAEPRVCPECGKRVVSLKPVPVMVAGAPERASGASPGEADRSDSAAKRSGGATHAHSR